MKNASLALLAHLALNATTTCLCVRIVRVDGTILGFTDCNIPFTYTLITNPDSVGPVVYSPISAQTSSSIKSTAGSGVDTLQLTGTTTSTALTDTDLFCDKYQGASVLVFTLNYMDLTMGEMVESVGYIGEVTITESGYSIEVLSLESGLKRYQGEVTSALCRVKEFGDSRCKFNVAAYTDTYTITSVSSSTQWQGTASPGAGLVGSQTNGWYDFGKVKAASGLNSGTVRSVKTQLFVSISMSVVTNNFLLTEAFPFPVSPGDTFAIAVGCDRVFASSCVAKFNNARNFRGEPYLPGNLRIIQTGRPNGG